MRFSFLCLTLTTLLAFPLSAQVDRATLNGTVTDVTGAMVAGAQVVAAAPATGFHRETITGSGGGYNFPGLPIGTYNITVTHAGFETVKFQALTLSVGQ